MTRPRWGGRPVKILGNSPIFKKREPYFNGRWSQPAGPELRLPPMLPKNTKLAAAGPKANTGAKNGGAGSTSRYAKILLIDCDDDSRMLIGRALLRAMPDSALLECASVECALELARGHPPSAVVVHRADHHDGVTAITVLRRHLARTPIVMISALDRRESAERAGASAFVARDDYAAVAVTVRDLLSSTPVSSNS